MQNLPNNKSLLLVQFEEYLLTAKKVSKNTLRNYRCDLNHFLSWAYAHLIAGGYKAYSPEELISHLSSNLIESYKVSHIKEKTALSTINRRLSTVRTFINFLLANGLISYNPAQNITNTTSLAPWSKEKKQRLLEPFKKTLIRSDVSRTTIKNYLSDIKHFLDWIENA
jgi:site-specific recombinase XerD